MWQCSVQVGDYVEFKWPDSAQHGGCCLCTLHLVNTCLPAEKGSAAHGRMPCLARPPRLSRCAALQACGASPMASALTSGMSLLMATRWAGALHKAVDAATEWPACSQPVHARQADPRLATEQLHARVLWPHRPSTRPAMAAM